MRRTTSLNARHLCNGVTKIGQTPSFLFDFLDNRDTR